MQGFPAFYTFLYVPKPKRDRTGLPGCLSFEFQEGLDARSNTTPLEHLQHVELMVKHRAEQQWSLAGNAVAVPLAQALGAVIKLPPVGNKTQYT
jgi:hypothetical protein